MSENDTLITCASPYDGVIGCKRSFNAKEHTRIEDLGKAAGKLWTINVLVCPYCGTKFYARNTITHNKLEKRKERWWRLNQKTGQTLKFKQRLQQEAIKIHKAQQDAISEGALLFKITSHNGG